MLAGELLRGALVDDDLDTRVRLEVGGGDAGRDLALDDLADGVGLLLAPSQQNDTLGLHDGADTHGNGHLGSLVEGEERPGLDLARFVGELHQPGARLDVGARLVEPDLPVAVDAENHQVDFADGSLVGGAIIGNPLLGDGTVGQMDVVGEDVDAVDELPADAVIAALLLVGPDGVELVETEDGDVGEADLAGLVPPD